MISVGDSYTSMDVHNATTRTVTVHSDARAETNGLYLQVKLLAGTGQMGFHSAHSYSE